MTTITDHRLLKLRDLTFTPKGEHTDWAHEFDAELRAVQDDLDKWRELESQSASINAEQDEGSLDLDPSIPRPLDPSAPADTDRVELTAAGADLIGDADEQLIREMAQLRARLRAAERITRAAGLIGEMSGTLGRSDWLPPDYMAAKFTEFAEVIDRAECESGRVLVEAGVVIDPKRGAD